MILNPLVYDYTQIGVISFGLLSMYNKIKVMIQDKLKMECLTLLDL